MEKEVIDMTKIEKGQRLVCEPCGREVVVDMCGLSESTMWCCNQPMVHKAAKKTKKKK